MNIQAKRWLTSALIASVALNLLLGGALLGRIFTERPPLKSFPPTMGWMLRGLPPEQRDTLGPVLKEHMKGAIAARRTLADAQQNASRLLGEQPLDEAALRQAFAELRAASSASQEIMHNAMVTLMAKLTPEQRQQMMPFVGGEMKHRPGDRRMGGGFNPMRQRPPPEESPTPAAPGS